MKDFCQQIFSCHLLHSSVSCVIPYSIANITVKRGLGAAAIIDSIKTVNLLGELLNYGKFLVLQRIASYIHVLTANWNTTLSTTDYINRVLKHCYVLEGTTYNIKKLKTSFIKSDERPIRHNIHSLIIASSTNLQEALGTEQVGSNTGLW